MRCLKLGFDLLHDILIMLIGPRIMYKLSLLIIVLGNILKSSHHMINFLNHFMIIINFFQIKFLFHLRQFRKLNFFSLCYKFSKLSHRDPIVLLIFYSLIHSEMIPKTDVREPNCIDNILTYLIDGDYYLFHLILHFFKVRVEGILEIDTFGFDVFWKCVLTHEFM